MKEKTIQTAVGIALWVVDGAMGLGLYLSFATGFISWVIAGLMVLGIEGAKILTWTKGGWYRILSIALSMLTLASITGTVFASIQTRISTSETAVLQSLHNSPQYKVIQEDVEMQTVQEKTLLARLAALPPDYPSAGARLVVEISEGRKQKTLAVTELTAMEHQAMRSATTDAPSIFTALAKLTGQDESNVELTLILVLALLIEASAFSLVSKAEPEPKGEVVTKVHQDAAIPVGTKKDVPIRTGDQKMSRSNVDSERYLREATAHPRSPYLLGRAVVAQRLHITDREARSLLAELILEGKVKRESKYFVAV